MTSEVTSTGEVDYLTEQRRWEKNIMKNIKMGVSEHCVLARFNKKDIFGILF